MVKILPGQLDIAIKNSVNNNQSIECRQYSWHSKIDLLYKLILSLPCIQSGNTEHIIISCLDENCPATNMSFAEMTKHHKGDIVLQKCVLLKL